MATVIRPEISKSNKYWISKHRYYELKHFCLQYPNWKRIVLDAYNSNISTSIVERIPSTNKHGDPTASLAVLNLYYMDRIKLIERIADETDKTLSYYILKGVTEGLSYTYLKTRLEIPCSRDMYYDRYRRFFWLLSQERN
jgi:hypothetical protein